MNYQRQPPEFIKDILEKHQIQYSFNDYNYYAWPQTFASTAGPSSGMGGAALCDFTIECWVFGVSGPYICTCAGMYAFRDKYFEPFVQITNWKTITT